MEDIQLDIALILAAAISSQGRIEIPVQTFYDLDTDKVISVDFNEDDTMIILGLVDGEEVE